MKLTPLILLSALLLASPCLAEEYQHAEDPEVTKALREQWRDINETLRISAAIRAQHAREAEQTRREAHPAPRSYSSAVPFPRAPALTPIPEPYMSREPDWFMLQTPSGDLYYNYGGGMLQGPHGELYQLY